MQLKVLFDSVSKSEGLATGWGLSFLIDGRILFDTGEKGSLLLNNIDGMGIELPLLEAVVLSHEHWDHTGGLWEILKRTNQLKVYICPGFSQEFKEKVRSGGGQIIAHSEFTEIDQNIFITGELKSEYKGQPLTEQGLVIVRPEGLTIITGCAHPGIVNLLEIVKNHFPDKDINFVLGGFHLMHDSPPSINMVVNKFKGLGVKKVGPAHCTGSDAGALFKKSFGTHFIPINVGDRISI